MSCGRCESIATSSQVTTTEPLYDLSFYLFFFLTIRRPPTSPLFPYTTLFRSHHARRARDPGPRDRPRPPLSRSVPDRKSTRLNSSHVSISYAVFCLKKKKRGR